jgi:hypothetical protein
LTPAASFETLKAKCLQWFVRIRATKHAFLQSAIK